MPEIIKITSRENRRLAEVKKVRDGKLTDRIFIEGTRLAAEALRSALEITEAVLSTSFLESSRGEKLLQELSREHVPMIETPDRLFGNLADTANSQGLILIANRPETGRRRLEPGGPSAGSGPFVFLHEINDPSNLGAVLRTAEAAGSAGVIISNGSADAFSPKALRAGMGSTFRVPVWEGATLLDAMEWARENGIRMIASDISGSKPYSEIDWSTPTLVVFGSEASGLNREQLGLVAEVIVIPMANGVESLNLSVSAGIILFESRRQRKERSAN